MALDNNGQWLNIVGNATTVIKTGAGCLISVIINTKGAAGAVKLYDDPAAANNPIGSIDSAAFAGPIKYGLAFTKGLVVVTTGAPDVTVVYR